MNNLIELALAKKAIADLTKAREKQRLAFLAAQERVAEVSMISGLTSVELAQRLRIPRSTVRNWLLDVQHRRKGESHEH